MDPREPFAAQPAIRWTPARGDPQDDRSRVIVGLHVASGCRDSRAAAVRLVGHGLSMRVQTLAQNRASIDPAVSARYDKIVRGHNEPGEAAVLAGELADHLGELTHQVTAAAGVASEQVLAVGVNEPGLWRLEASDRAYESLCDAARLAERTGATVIDGFAARDLAQGGQGGPLLAIPYWIMLGDRRQTRALLDLGRTVKFTWLPAGEAEAADWVVSFDVGPGTDLLDRLAEQLTEGKRPFDHGGHLAVQGRRIPELVEHWLEDPYFRRTPPRWHPLGCRHDREFDQTVEMAIRSGWSIRDLLCTGCHFIAETIALAIGGLAPQSPALDEIVLSGGGQQNGMLLRQIAARLGAVKTTSAAALAFDQTTLEPTAVAVLAALTLDQVPASRPLITGANVPRVVGRITPGAPHNWNRVLRELHAQRPRTMALRHAM